MKKFWIQVVVLIIVALGAIYVSFNQSFLGEIIPVGKAQPMKHLKISNAVVQVEVADNPSSRSKGLGGRESLASNSGMLFVFPEDKKYQFFIKNIKYAVSNHRQKSN